ncbi:YegS/Rv2252/BmrU family lipid kinase [Bacteroides salyersiae]|uniref:diacylglycerol/lipid kinase family protein n=1 Tax=Bacteroides salyersiae TaxID=291644 RepID=UPI001C00DE7E|nr:diacylglycerol kinase family protein [Bacteroides salyersiae]MBT9874291.1 YegS/Rv2252/BmrU family lipid kinase [Bacteroides salyersiae]
MNENMKKLIFIVNPISGTQSKELILNLLDEKIDKEKYIWDVVYTKRAGHAIEIAAQAAEMKTDVVVAIGGDGTINEIGRSLVHTETALGIIPCGSGNGLARHLHIPMEPKKALEIINDGICDIIDYGKINGTDFFCTCGVGFDAFVSLKFANAGKRGLLTYLEKTLQESLTYQPETYELETEDGTYKYKAFLIACGNASQYGNNAYIAPQATLTDGLLDVTILEPFTVLDVPSLAFQLFNKTIDQNSRIKTFRCKNLRIHRSKPGVIHFDGDPMQADENVNIKIIQKGLRVIVPKTTVEKDNANVLQRAQEYVNGIRMINEAIVDNITHKNQKIIKKLTRKD